MDSVDASARPGGRIPGVEGLRALAASAIVLLHVWWVPSTPLSRSSTGILTVLLEPLNEGVPLFFVLSGFLLWRPVAAAVLRHRGLPSVRRYARNRALRILPAYWAVLLVTALVLQSARLTPLSGDRDGAIRNPILLAKDALLVQNYAPHTISSGLAPAWSLAVEMVFYILVPLFALVAAGLAARSASRRRRLTATLVPAALLVAIGVLGKLVAVFVVPGFEDNFQATWHSVIDKSFLTHADLFAFGMVVAVLRVEHEDGRFSLSAGKLALVNRVLAYGSVPFLVAGYLLIPHYIYEPLVALLCALLLAKVALRHASPHPSGLVRLLERRPVVAVGAASYSVFLWNYPVTEFLMHHGLILRGNPVWDLPVNVAIVVPIVAGLSAVSYLTIERTAMRLRGTPRRPVPQAVRPAVIPPTVSPT
jgi:peptidoglycan/LPS O-acetylase OafA/YrhL